MIRRALCFYNFADSESLFVIYILNILFLIILNFKVEFILFLFETALTSKIS
jgi:hypothetical protein